MVASYRDNAAQKAIEAGLQASIIKQSGKRVDCEAYLKDGTWATAWGIPKPIVTKKPYAANPYSGPANAPKQIESPRLVSEAAIIEFSTFEKLKKSAATTGQMSMQDFIELLTKHDIRPDKDGQLFSPALFNGSRSNTNFISASGVCLDFDNGNLSIHDVLAIFREYLAIYYTTHSHTPENKRFRVVLPLSHAVNAEEHAWLVKGIKSVIPPELLDCIDSSCFDRARAHYLPSCPPETRVHAFSGCQSGELLNVTYYIRLGKKTERPCISEMATYQPVVPVISTATQVKPTDFFFVSPQNNEPLDLKLWAARNPDFDIVSAITPVYRRGVARDGKQHIICPFQEQHTDKSDDFATYVVNATPPQYAAFDVHCCHAHCLGRDRLEFIKAMLEKGYMSVDQLNHIQDQSTKPALKRPLYINYRAQEIAMRLTKQPLTPVEFQRLLHLMHIACSVHNGTLPIDDDFNLRRALGLSGEELKQLKEILFQSGWLCVENGRMFNEIFRREYQIAQTELMKKSMGGQKGGKTTQQRKKEREAHLYG